NTFTGHDEPLAHYFVVIGNLGVGGYFNRHYGTRMTGPKGACSLAKFSIISHILNLTL
ncbi:hypothetical protein ACJX0J_014110, partial [Zea mays]